MNNTIQCPACNHSFAIEKALFSQLENQQNKILEEKAKEQENLFQEKQLELEKERKEFEAKKEKENQLFKDRLTKKLEEERLLIEQKKQAEFEGRLKQLQSENEQQKTENKNLKEKELELLKKESRFNEVQENFELELARRSSEEREKLTAELKEKEKIRAQNKAEEIQKEYEEKYSQKITLLQDENEKRKRENNELKVKELEILKKEQALKEEKELLDLEMQKKMLAEKEQIVRETRKLEQEKNELRVREYEKKLDDQKKLIEMMQRKAEQGSMQMQGEVQELALEELLRNRFPFDEIEEVGKGVKGADAIQLVKNPFQQVCGKILFESKRTKSFSDGWIEKLQEDIREQNADIGVIVTETMPKEMEKFGRKDGIWICNFHDVEYVVFVLREMLLREHTVRSSFQNKGEKMELLYSYLVSEEFKQRVETIVNGFSTLQQEMNREKRAMQKIWKEREKQIEKVIGNTIDMYGSIRGIAGNAIPQVKELELFPDSMDELDLE